MEEEIKNGVFVDLFKIDVNEHKEKKGDLDYLSWPWAWAEVRKRYPQVKYEVWHDENHRPYVNDPKMGIMCFTSVTIGDETHGMWLPVMDANNRAMREESYTVQVFDRYKKTFVDKQVQAATMFDINKTIMRCLVKNLAMFGLGLYIYSGEDLPEVDIPDAPIAQKAESPYHKDSVDLVIEIIKVCKTTDKVREVMEANPQFKDNEELKSEANKKWKELNSKTSTNQA